MYLGFKFFGTSVFIILQQAVRGKDKILNSNHCLSQHPSNSLLSETLNSASIS